METKFKHAASVVKLINFFHLRTKLHSFIVSHDKTGKYNYNRSWKMQKIF